MKTNKPRIWPRLHRTISKFLKIYGFLPRSDSTSDVLTKIPKSFHPSHFHICIMFQRSDILMKSLEIISAASFYFPDLDSQSLGFIESHLDDPKFVNQIFESESLRSQIREFIIKYYGYDSFEEYLRMASPEQLAEARKILLKDGSKLEIELFKNRALVDDAKHFAASLCNRDDQSV